MVAGPVEVGEDGPGRIRQMQIDGFAADSLQGFLGANFVTGATARTDGTPGAFGVTRDPHLAGNMAAHAV